MNIKVYTNSTHGVSYSHAANRYEVYLLASPDATIKRFPYAESRGFECAVACAMHEEYTLAKENARKAA